MLEGDQIASNIDIKHEVRTLQYCRLTDTNTYLINSTQNIYNILLLIRTNENEL